ncbi:MAG: hypothetical protein AAB513_03280 [Patescibacteria group bacterium]
MAHPDQNKKFNVEVGSDGIINLSLGGNLEGINLIALEKWIEEVHKAIEDRYQNTYVPVKVLIDVTAVTGYAPEAVTLLTNLLVADKNYVYRSATFGATEYILMAQDMLASLSGRNNFRSFKTKEEAKAWVSSTTT